MEFSNSKIINLKNSWGLSCLKPFKNTPTAKLFKAKNSHERDVVLKVFTSKGSEDESAGRFFFERNSNLCAKLLYENKEALLLEFLEGRDLYQFSMNNNEPVASAIFIDLISRYDLSPVQQIDNLLKVSDLYNIFDKVQLPNDLNSDLQKAKRLSEELSANEINLVLLHGDLHHENIIGSLDYGFKVIDPKGIIGEIEYELGAVLKNPWAHPQISHCASQFDTRLAELSDGLCLNKKKVVSYCFVHILLSICWSLQSGEDIQHQRNVLKVVRKYF